VAANEDLSHEEEDEDVILANLKCLSISESDYRQYRKGK
jgi:hypothetical protein